MIVDLFAGPGGWSEGLRTLSPEMHATEIGLEWDASACATRAAARHRTIRTDIAAYPTEPFNQVVGLIASPPCQDFSLAGNRAGITGERGQLITQVLRWTENLRPEWVACEQVPPALPVWKQYAEHLRGLGYSAWAGVLNAADYGAPQTRRRAFLIASRVRDVHPPEPTHAQYPAPSLFGDDQLPWVTMADALGWSDGRILNPGATGSDRSDLNRRHYSLDEPAPTMAFGHDSAGWKWMFEDRAMHRRDEIPAWASERPATTLVSSFCPDIVAGPGVDLTRPRQDREGAIRITPVDALILQSFPPDYPVQGTKTKAFEQIGNAVPPRLAAHVLSAASGHPLLIP
jgi:DNA (cytosine-5)-methyltransferase 1